MEHIRKQPFRIGGFVEWIGEERRFGSNGFRKRELVIADDPRAERPNFTLLEYTGDRCDLLANVRRGDRVEAEFWTDARYWEPKDGGKQGRWFGSLRAVALKVEGADAAGLSPAPQQAATDPAPDGGASDLPAGDDLPF